MRSAGPVPACCKLLRLPCCPHVYPLPPLLRRREGVLAEAVAAFRADFEAAQAQVRWGCLVWCHG